MLFGSYLMEAIPMCYELIK